MILVSLSGCYGILHQINLILNLVVVFHFFPVFLLCKKIQAYRISQIV